MGGSNAIQIVPPSPTGVEQIRVNLNGESLSVGEILFTNTSSADKANGAGRDYTILDSLGTGVLTLNGVDHDNDSGTLGLGIQQTGDADNAISARLQGTIDGLSHQVVAGSLGLLNDENTFDAADSFTVGTGASEIYRQDFDSNDGGWTASGTSATGPWTYSPTGGFEGGGWQGDGGENGDPFLQSLTSPTIVVPADRSDIPGIRPSL